MAKPGVPGRFAYQDAATPRQHGESPHPDAPDGPGRTDIDGSGCGSFTDGLLSDGFRKGARHGSVCADRARGPLVSGQVLRNFQRAEMNPQITQIGAESVPGAIATG